MENVISLVILAILAIITQYIVSWAGSILSSIGTEETPYAVFTFTDDRYMPMTNNILMNVCIPNICMIFIFMIARNGKYIIIEKNLIYYVVFFFLYRMILICILYRRKEMYTWYYELGMAIAGILVAYYLTHDFFTTEEAVFITPSELREELWFIVLIVLYKFFKMIFDKKVIQNTVLTKGQISKYVINKFNKFYKKYNDFLDINVNTRYICILLYAVMIFEDYNRGPLIRKFERIKIRITKKGTIGIMQFPSDKPISDEESVVNFYNWLETKAKELNTYQDDIYINNVLWQYNNDTDYAKSVTYIYHILYNYIDDIPKYRSKFHMREGIEKGKEPYSIHRYHKKRISNSNNLRQNIQSDEYLDCNVGKYDISPKYKWSNDVEISEDEEECEIAISNVEHVYINGNGSVFYAKTDCEQILYFKNCKNIVLDNIKLIGSLKNEENEVGLTALKFENCRDVVLKNIEIYDGEIGLEFSNGNINIQNCKIHNCMTGAINLDNAECVFDKLIIYECEGDEESIITINNCNVLINNSKIYKNKTDMYIFDLLDTNIICNKVEVQNNIFSAVSSEKIEYGIIENGNELIPE